MPLHTSKYLRSKLAQFSALQIQFELDCHDNGHVRHDNRGDEELHQLASDIVRDTKP